MNNQKLLKRCEQDIKSDKVMYKGRDYIKKKL